MGTTRALAIIRVSQQDNDAHSPEVQIRAALKLAADYELTLDPADILNENIDDNGKVRKAASGGWGLDRRPKLLYAIEEVEASRAVAILGERADRWFRDMDLQREVIRRVGSAGGRLLSTNGELSHATAEAELQANIGGAVSQYTKRTAMERSWDAVELAIEQGKIPWSQTAPGYTKDDESLLHPDLEVKPVIVDAFQMRREGATIEAVRDFLHDHGIERSYHGTAHLLRDRVYIGEIHFGTHTPNLNAHDAIIDRDLFEDVQKVKKTRGRRAKSERLLARLGVLVCGSCGARMVVGTQRQNGRDYPFYRCPGKGSKEAKQRDCAQRMTIGAEIAEEWLVEQLKEEIEEIKGHWRSELGLDEALSKAERSQAAYAKAQRILADAEDENEAQGILAEKRRTRDADREAYETLLARQVLANWVVNAKDWGKMTRDEQRQLIHAAIYRVQVNPGRGVERLSIVWR